MMAAMMFPTAAPMILTFHKVQAGKRQRGYAFVSTWVFVAVLSENSIWPRFAS
jgi:predicted metal-binding membrane protein